MLTLTLSTRVFVATKPADMRLIPGFSHEACSKKKRYLKGCSETVAFPNTESRAACETAGTRCRYRSRMASVVCPTHWSMSR